MQYASFVGCKHFKQPQEQFNTQGPTSDAKSIMSHMCANRPINRAPLGHTRFFCKGALFPWPDKTSNQFPIQFFTFSRRHHSKWFRRYINHISYHALTLKQTMNRPLIPDSYPFYCRILCCGLKFLPTSETDAAHVRYPG